MTRFLHTADLHLNAQRSSFPNYLLRAEWLLQEIEDLAIDEHCACIVVAGDVFEHPNTTIAERQLLSDWLGRVKTPVLMISGNHDARSRTIGDTCISYLASLRLQLHLVHDREPRVLTAFGCNWILLPYHGWTDQEFRLIVRTAMLRAQAKNPDLPVVAVAHEAVRGARTDRNIAVKSSDQITLVPDLGPTYWALGDIHAPQQMLSNAYYCGSPYQVNFGETVDGKGVLLVDTENPESPVSVQLECPYPLVSLDEVPTEWPLFGHYTGAWVDDLPEHVIYRPKGDEQRPQIDIRRAHVSLFHRLREKLIEQNHPEQLLDRTVDLANKMAKELNLDV